MAADHKYYQFTDSDGTEERYAIEDNTLSVTIWTKDDDIEADYPDDLDCAKGSLQLRLDTLKKEAVELEAFLVALNSVTEYETDNDE